MSMSFVLPSSLQPHLNESSTVAVSVSLERLWTDANLFYEDFM